jgi:hypothetical protein
VKRDVERLQPLWIVRCAVHDPSAPFHVKPDRSVFINSVTHSLWIEPAPDVGGSRGLPLGHHRWSGANVRKAAPLGSLDGLTAGPTGRTVASWVVFLAGLWAFSLVPDRPKEAASWEPAFRRAVWRLSTRPHHPSGFAGQFD